MFILKNKRIFLLEILTILYVFFYCLFNATKRFVFRNVSGFSGFLIVGLSFLIIIIVTHYLFSFFKNLIINKDKHKLKSVIIFLLYALYLIVMLVLIRKFFGISGQNAHGDMSTIIYDLERFEFCSYQGWYASIFYFIGFSLFPLLLSNYAVVLFQIIVSSIFFSYVYSFFDKNYGKLAKIMWIIANTIFPAVFFNQFCLRLLWIAQLIIVLAIQIMNLKNTDSRNKTYLKIMLLTALIAVVRPEAVVYIPFVLLFTIFINKDLKIKRKIIYTLIIIVAFILVRIPQKDNNEYKSTALFNPLSYLVSYDNLNWGNGDNAKEKGIEAINKVFDYEALKKYSSYTGLDLAFNDPFAWHKNFSKEDFNGLLKTYIKLVIYNPIKWAKGRFLTFTTSFSSSGILSYQVFFGKFIDNPLINFIIHFIYSPLLLLLINILAIIYYIYKKNKIKFIVSAFALIEAIMIFTVGTSSAYMFIYPIWFISFFISIIFISDIVKRKEKNT